MVWSSRVPTEASRCDAYASGQVATWRALMITQVATERTRRGRSPCSAQAREAEIPKAAEMSPEAVAGGVALLRPMVRGRAELRP